MKVVDLRPEKERNVEKNGSVPLKKPLENKTIGELRTGNSCSF